MSFGVTQLRQLCHSELCGRIRYGRHRKSDKDLVGVEPGVVRAEVLNLQLLDRLDYRRVDDIDLFRDFRERFESVEQHCGTGSKKISRLAREDPSAPTPLV